MLCGSLNGRQVGERMDTYICMAESFYSPPETITTWLISYHCSVAKSCLTLFDPIDYSTPGFPVLHYLLEFAQTPVH